MPRYPRVINDAANKIMPTLLYMPLYLILCTLDLSSHGTTNNIAMLAAKIINPRNLLVIPKNGIPKVIALKIE